jgi:heme exporter protein D
MMPDLGTYAAEVTLAYVISLTALTALIGWSWLRSRKTRRDLDALESRLTRKTNGQD